MAAALEQELHGRGIPSVGVWAQVPHYVASMSYPAASVALLDGLATAAGIAVDAGDLRREAVLQRERLDQLIETNPEHQAMVEQFERLFDASDDAAETVADPTGEGQPGDGALELRSGDELAGEIERFLRDRGDK
jgi:hypothetical protein